MKIVSPAEAQIRGEKNSLFYQPRNTRKARKNLFDEFDFVCFVTYVVNIYWFIMDSYQQSSWTKPFIA